MKSILTVLRAARDMLAKGWTQHASARDARGLSVDDRDSAACYWCMLGAISAAAGGDKKAYSSACDKVRLFTGESISYYNDRSGRTKEEVLMLMDYPIRSLEEAAQ